MVTRSTAPAGAPCWADLWTSDVERAGVFYGALFGWVAEEPNPDFGGYFMFTRNGAPVAGGMGGMGEMKANNTWKAFLATYDMAKTLAAATTEGATIEGPAMPVADLGSQAVLSDPGGAVIGAWQPGTFHGFSILNEPGAPSWFELHTRDFGRAVHFYASVFGWDITPVSDSDDFRYSTVKPADGGDEVGGIMDASRFHSEGQPDRWDIYWNVEDCAASVQRVRDLGGSVVQGPDDTPYGIMAAVADPMGGAFKLLTPPAS